MTSKTVEIRGTKYRLKINRMNWLMLWDKGRSYPVAKMVNENEEAYLDDMEATRYASNEELVRAFLTK